jgi:transcriptional regulator GlxA family with amidase domain
MSLSIGILVFNNVELLDFAGPMQVFLAAKHLDPGAISTVETIGLTDDIVISKSGTRLIPEKYMIEADKYDLLVIPGGIGTRSIIKDEESLNLIDHLVDKSAMCATVCTGALVLAQLKRLNGLKVTTHFAALDEMQNIDPTLIIDRSKRIHDHGRYIISEGVSAGIDMAFHYLSKYVNEELSLGVRKYIEYYPEKI